MDHVVALTLAALHGVPAGLIAAATGAVTPRGQRSPAVVMVALITAIVAVAAWFLTGDGTGGGWPMLMVIPGGLLMALTGNELRRRPDGATTGPLTGLVGTTLLALGVFAQGLDVFSELTASTALHLTGLIGMAAALVLAAALFTLGANGSRTGRLPASLAWAALIGGGLFVLQGIVVATNLLWPAIPAPSAVMAGVGAIMAALIPWLATQQAKSEQAAAATASGRRSGDAEGTGAGGTGRGTRSASKQMQKPAPGQGGSAGKPTKPSGQRQQPRRKGRGRR